mgnify:CR=1 FL=1
MKLEYTRALITAALNGELDNVEYKKQEVFGLAMPVECPGVPSEMLDPKNTWADKTAYDTQANELAVAFVKNFSKFEEYAGEEILSAAPKAAATPETDTAVGV